MRPMDYHLKLCPFTSITKTKTNRWRRTRVSPLYHPGPPTQRPRTVQVGNIPPGLSHLALINAAHAFVDADSEKSYGGHEPRKEDCDATE